jgi:hypothetical protein
MSNPQVSPGQSAVQGVSGLAADQSTILPLGSLTATIDNYAAAFVAKISPSGAPANYGYYNLVPKNVPAGSTITVTVTLTATNASGAPLPPVTQSYDLIGPPLPPQDTTVVLSPANISTQFATASSDPGTATATLI